MLDSQTLYNLIHAGRALYRPRFSKKLSETTTAMRSGPGFHVDFFGKGEGVGVDETVVI